MNEKELLSFILRAKNRKQVLLLLDKGSKAQAEITKMTGM
jgi:predicted transcriptional regulator